MLDPACPAVGYTPDHRRVCAEGVLLETLHAFEISSEVRARGLETVQAQPGIDLGDGIQRVMIKLGIGNFDQLIRAEIGGLAYEALHHPIIDAKHGFLDIEL